MLISVHARSPLAPTRLAVNQRPMFGNFFETY